jgi:hypothetical protein
MKTARTFLVGFTAALILVAGPISSGLAEAALGVDFSRNAPYENGSALGTYPVVGWSFSPTRDVYLTGLGLWDQDTERRHSENHLVGAWDANQTLLGYVSIAEPVGSPHNTVTGSMGAQYHMAYLSAPILLRKNQVYYVGATLFAQMIGQSTDFDAFASFNPGEAPISFNRDITFLKNAYGTSAVNQLVFPGLSTQPTYLFGANIDVTPVPIPAAVWLLGSGLVGLVGVRRNMKRIG